MAWWNYEPSFAQAVKRWEQRLQEAGQQQAPQPRQPQQPAYAPPQQQVPSVSGGIRPLPFRPEAVRQARPLEALPPMPPGAPEYQQVPTERATQGVEREVWRSFLGRLPQFSWAVSPEERERLPEWLQGPAEFLGEMAVGGAQRLGAAWRKPEERAFMPPVAPSEPEIPGETFGQRQARLAQERVTGGPAAWGVPMEPVGKQWERLTQQAVAPRRFEQLAGVGLAALQEPAYQLEQLTGAAAIALRPESRGMSVRQWAPLTERTWSLAYHQATGEPGTDILGEALTSIASGTATAEQIAMAKEHMGAELVGQLLADPLNIFDWLQAAARVRKAAAVAKAERRLAKAAELEKRAEDVGRGWARWEMAKTPEGRQALEAAETLLDGLERRAEADVKALQEAAKAKGEEVQPSAWDKLKDAFRRPFDLTPASKAERDSNELWIVLSGPMSEARNGDEALGLLTSWADEPGRLTQFFGNLPVSESGRKAQTILQDIMDDVPKLPSLQADEFNPALFMAEVDELAMARLKDAYGYKEPSGLLKFANAWKAYMSEFYLTAIYSPGYVLRNTASDLMTMGVDGLVSFENVEDIDRYFDALGGLTTKRISTGGKGMRYELTGMMEGESRLPGVLGTISRKGQEITRYGEPFGRLPIGEEARYKRAFYKGLQGFLRDNVVKRTPQLPTEARVLYGPQADDLLHKVAQALNPADKRKALQEFLDATGPGQALEPTRYVDIQDLDAMSPTIAQQVREEIGKLPPTATEDDVRAAFAKVRGVIEDDEARRLKDLQALPTQKVATNADEMELADGLLAELEKLARDTGDPRIVEKAEEMKHAIPRMEAELDAARAEAMDAVKVKPTKEGLDALLAANRDAEALRDQTRAVMNKIRGDTVSQYQANPRLGQTLWPEYGLKAADNWGNLTQRRIERYRQATEQLARIGAGEKAEDVLGVSRAELAEWRLRKAGEVVPDAPKGFMPGKVLAAEENEKFEAFLRNRRATTDQNRTNAWRAAYGTAPENYGHVIDLLDSAERDVDLFGKATAGRVRELVEETMKKAAKAMRRHRDPAMGKLAAKLEWEKFYIKRNDEWNKYYKAAEQRWKIAERDVLMENFRGPQMDLIAPAAPMPRAELRPEDAELVRRAALKPEELWTPEELGAVQRWTGNGKAIPEVEQALLPLRQDAPPYTRERFTEDLKANFNLTDEEADAVQAVADARARTWAAHTGRDPSEWYKERLASFGRNSAGESLYFQVGPGDPDAAAVITNQMDRIEARGEMDLVGRGVIHEDIGLGRTYAAPGEGPGGWTTQDLESGVWKRLAGEEMEGYNSIELRHIDEAAKGYVDLKAQKILPEAKPGIQAEARPGHVILYRTARDPREVVQILDAAERGLIGEGFRPSVAHVRTKVRRIVERAAKRGQTPVYTSNYPSVSAFYHEWNCTLPKTFAFEIPEEAILYTSTQAAKEAGGTGIAYAAWFVDTEIIIDAQQIKRAWHLPDELAKKTKEWAEELHQAQTRKTGFANAFRDADPELAEAGAAAIRDLREPPASLGRPFLEAPLDVNGNLTLQKGDRVVLATGDVVTVQGHTMLSPEQSAQFHNGAHALFKVNGYKGPDLPGTLGAYNMPDTLIAKVIKKGERITAADKARFAAEGRPRMVEHLQARINDLDKYIAEAQESVAKLEAQGQTGPRPYEVNDPWGRVERLQEGRRQVEDLMNQYKDPETLETYQPMLFQKAEPVWPEQLTLPMLDEVQRRQAGELVALHNLHGDGLRFADGMGGLALPSVAVTKKEFEFAGYGDVTLIGHRGMIDPELSGLNRVFDADAYTPTYPEMLWPKVRSKEAQMIVDRMRAAQEQLGAWEATDQLWERMTRYPNYNKALETFEHQAPCALAYLLESDVPGARSLGPVRVREMGKYEGFITDDVADWVRANQDELRRLLGREEYIPLEDRLAGMQESPVFQEFSRRILDEVDKAYRRYDMKPSIFAPDEWADPKTGLIRWGKADDVFTSWGKMELPYYRTDHQATARQVWELLDENPQLKKEYQAWAKGILDPVFEAPMLKLRGRNVPYTLPNVVEAMKSQAIRGGEKTMTVGPSKARALGAREFKTVEEMREAAGRLATKEEVHRFISEEQKPILDYFQNVIIQKTTRRNWEGKPDTWRALDDAMQALGDYLKGGRKGRSFEMLERALVQNGFTNITERDLEWGMKAAEILRDTPTEYFEAKIWRAVGLDEFSGAVVPEGTDPEIIRILNKHGLDIEYYNASQRGARQAAVGKFFDREGVLFQAMERQEELAPIWYSKLERNVATKMPNQAPVEQVRNIVKKGVSKDELEFTGIMDWLDEQEGMITKKQVMDYLDQNGIQVEEVVKGGIRRRGVRGAADAEAELNRRGYEIVWEPDAYSDELVPAAVRAPDGTGYLYDDDLSQLPTEDQGLIDTVFGMGEAEDWTFHEGYGDILVENPYTGELEAADQQWILENPQDPNAPPYTVRRDVYFDAADWDDEAGAMVAPLESEDWILEQGGNFITGGTLPEVRGAAEEAMREAINASREAPKYAQYTVPGGEAYTELLLRWKRPAAPEIVTTPKGLQRAGFEWKANQQGLWAWFDPAGYQVSGAFPSEEHVAGAANSISGRILQERAVPPRQRQYRGSHWGEEDVLVHVRFTERKADDGARVLFLEEVQSDWHQAGRERGYSTVSAATAQEAVNRAQAKRNQLNDIYLRATDEANRTGTPESLQKLDEAWKNYTEADEAYNQAVAAQNQAIQGVPPAPFAKSWDELALKRMLRWAAENGYDRIAWTTGAQQAERYNLGKFVDRLGWEPSERVLIGYKNGEIAIQQRLDSADQLADYVGKEAAKKLTARESVDTTSWKKRTTGLDPEWKEAYTGPHGHVQLGIRKDGTAMVKDGTKIAEYKTAEEAWQAATERFPHIIEGEDLQVGGQGMLTFYDEILPYSLDKLTKKYGMKTVRAGVEGPTPTRLVGAGGELPGGWKIVQDDYGYYRAQAPNGRYAGGRHTTYADALAAMKMEAAPTEVHAINLTSEARQAVLFEGQPLLQAKKGATQFLSDGRAVIHAFEQADVSTALHELAHVFRRELAGHELETMEKWFGVTKGAWTTEAEEKFARAFERYMREGRAPSPELKGVFERFREWLREIYKVLTGSSIDVKIHDEVRGVFDRLLVETPETRPFDERGRQLLARRGAAEAELAKRAERAEAVLEEDALQALADYGEVKGGAHAGLHPTSLEDAAEAFGTGDNWGALEQELTRQGMDLEQYTTADGIRWQAANKSGHNLKEPAYVEVGGYTKEIHRERVLTRAEEDDLYFELQGIDPKASTATKRAAGIKFRAEMKELSDWYYTLAEEARRMAAGEARTFPVPPERLVEDLMQRVEQAPEALYQAAGEGEKARPQFGAPARKAPAQAAMWETGEELPLFSGAAQRVEAPKFAPPTAGAQAALPGMEPELGEAAKFAARPVEAAEAAEELEALRPAKVPEGQQTLWQELEPERWRLYQEEAAKAGATHGPQLADIVQAGTRATERALDQMEAGIIGDWGKWQPQVADTATKQALSKWLEQDVIPRWHETRAVGLDYARSQADFALLDYGQRRNFDVWLNMVFPYHYWFTRSGWNWAQRLGSQPGLVSRYIRARDAMKKANEQAGRRQRFETKLRIPFPWLPQWMGGSLYVDPLRFMLPFANLYGTRWDDADEGRKGMQALFGAIEATGFRPYHFWELPYKAGWFAKAGEALGMEQAAAQEYLGPEVPGEFGFFLPQTRAIQAATAAAREAGAGAIPPGGINIEAPLRQLLGLPAGEAWDPYRTSRMIANLAAEDPSNMQAARTALMAQELLRRDEQQTAKTWSPESELAQQVAQEMNWSGEDLAAAQQMLQKAMQRAAMERGIGTVGWALGPSMAVEPTGERAQLEMAEQARAQGWTPEAPGGSRAAYEQFKQGYPAMYPRASQYATMPGEPETGMAPGYRANWLMLKQAKQQINDQFDAQVDELLRAEPWNWEGRRALEDQRYTALQEAKAQYPTGEFTGEIPPILYGMNPAEMWDSVTEDQLYDLQNTKPDPDIFQDAEGAVDWAAYYDAVDDWKARLPQQFSFGQVQDGTYKGLTVREALEEFEQRYDSPLEAAYKVYQEQIASPTWDAYHKTKNWQGTVGSIGPISGQALVPMILQQYRTKGWTSQQLQQQLAGVQFPSLADQLSLKRGTKSKTGTAGQAAGGGGKTYTGSLAWLSDPEVFKRMEQQVQTEGWRAVYGDPWWEKYRRGGGGGGGGGRSRSRATTASARRWTPAGYSGRWRPPITIEGGPWRR